MFGRIDRKNGSPKLPIMVSRTNHLYNFGEQSFPLSPWLAPVTFPPVVKIPKTKKAV